MSGDYIGLLPSGAQVAGTKQAIQEMHAHIWRAEPTTGCTGQTRRGDPMTYQVLYQTDCGNIIYEQDNGYPGCVVLAKRHFARIGYVDTMGQDVLFEQDERGWCTLDSEEAERLIAAGVWQAMN